MFTSTSSHTHLDINIHITPHITQPPQRQSVPQCAPPPKKVPNNSTQQLGKQQQQQHQHQRHQQQPLQQAPQKPPKPKVLIPPNNSDAPQPDSVEKEQELTGASIIHDFFGSNQQLVGEMLGIMHNNRMVLTEQSPPE